MQLVLASASPRRIEILSKAYDNIIVFPANLDETFDKSDVEAICLDLAEKKARKVAAELVKAGKDDICILAADTLVSLYDKIYEKPKDRAEAFNFFNELCGKRHKVTTAVCVIYLFDGRQNICSGFRNGFVTFADIDEVTFPLINAYIDSGAPYDKAGGYGIQELDNKLIKKIEGGLDNIIGLPLDLAKSLITRATNVNSNAENFAHTTG